MAVAHVCSALNLSVSQVRRSPKLLKLPTFSRIPTSNFARDAKSFVRGSPLVFPTRASRAPPKEEKSKGKKIIRRSSVQRKAAARAYSASIRCEQSAKESNSLDVWLGRLAMVGFAVAITVEISTGKGLLENFGLTTPLPAVALAVTALVGVLTAVFIFQSATKN